MKRKVRQDRDELRPEYDLDYSQAIRGKYYGRLVKEGSNVVVLDPDVAQRFRSSAAVNAALRRLLKRSRPKQRTAGPTDRRRGAGSRTR